MNIWCATAAAAAAVFVLSTNRDPHRFIFTGCSPTQMRSWKEQECCCLYTYIYIWSISECFRFYFIKHFVSTCRPSKRNVVSLNCINCILLYCLSVILPVLSVTVNWLWRRGRRHQLQPAKHILKTRSLHVLCGALTGQNCAEPYAICLMNAVVLWVSSYWGNDEDAKHNGWTRSCVFKAVCTHTSVHSQPHKHGTWSWTDSDIQTHAALRAASCRQHALTDWWCCAPAPGGFGSCHVFSD